MTGYPRSKQRHGVLWVLCLSVVMLLVQSADIHVHLYNHDHESVVHSEAHDGFLQGHICSNACESAHHHEAGITTDVTPQWGSYSQHLKILQVALIAAAILALLVFWLPGQLSPPLPRQPIRIRHIDSPPPRLRAPPR